VATDTVIWDPVETLSRDELADLQLQRLRATIGRVLDAQPLGAQRLRDSGLTTAQDLSSLDELPQLPFTIKSDLRDHYPYGLIAVPREELVRVQASSGSHGKPTVVAYTRADLDGWTELMARSMTMAGVRPGMTIHNANGYGLFTGGLGFHQGGERIGANVVPVSGGRTARQAMLIQDLEPEVLVSSPSYSLVIGQALKDAGVARDELPLQLGLFGGEPWGERMREQIEAALGLRAVAFYGLSEMCGPGVATECLTVRDGLHVQEDHFLVEVIDPDDGTLLAAGQEGELVFTTLAKEALPLIRYRTGDLGTLTDEPCPCGRTMTRISRLRGRQDDMLIIRGVNLYPSEVEHVLLGIPGASPHYRIIIERPGAMDEITLECEAVDGADPDTLRARAEQRLKDDTGLRFTVDVLPAGAVPRSEGKAVRVLDRREL
jgi:phenylacetate-CoA ligase